MDTVSVWCHKSCSVKIIHGVQETENMAQEGLFLFLISCCPDWCWFLMLPLLLSLRQEAVVISGKKLARQIREEARADVEKWVLAGHRRPHLSVILVGDNPASHSYVLNKTRAAADVGKKGKAFAPNMCMRNTYSDTRCRLFSNFLNLPQESAVKRSSSIQTSVRRSY